MIQRPDQELIGVIGLGLMGTALTERLLEHGFRVAVWKRTREKAAPLVARGAQWSDNPLATCERVIISLYTTEVVETVLAELDSGLHDGQILLDTTTGEPSQTAMLGALMASVLFAGLWGSYPKVGATCGLIYLLGLIVIWWAPDTSRRNLEE